MSEQEAIAYIEEWDVTEAAKVLKWYEEDELLRPCDCDTIVAIETENLHAENDKLRELVSQMYSDMQGALDMSTDTVWVDSNTAIASWLASMSKSELIDECFFWHDVALEHGRMHNAVKGENAELRELVRFIMHQCNDGNPRCDECVGWNDGECVALQRMRELGVVSE